MDVKEYLVTLGIRPAELSGLKELPGSTKDRLTPLVLLAPWLATTPISRAFDKFEEAYPSRPYFIDVDTYYRVCVAYSLGKASPQSFLRPQIGLGSFPAPKVIRGGIAQSIPSHRKKSAFRFAQSFIVEVL